MGRKKLNKKDFKKIRAIRISDNDMKLIKRFKASPQSIINSVISHYKFIEENKKIVSKKEKND